MQSGTFLETINNKYWAVIVDLEIWVHGLFTFIHEYILYFIQSLCSLSFAHEELKIAWLLAKADRRFREEKKFYHQFSIIKYSYLPIDTFKKYVETHVT